MRVQNWVLLLLGLSANSASALTVDTSQAGMFEVLRSIWRMIDCSNRRF